MANTKPDWMADDEYNWLTSQKPPVTPSSNVVDTTNGGTQYSPIGFGDVPSYKPTPFKAPRWNDLSFGDALSQAKGQLTPGWDAARTAAGTANQQGIARLRQALNARGMLDAGALSEGMKGLNANLTGNLTALDTAYNTQANALAQSLIDRDMAARQQAIQNAFSAWQAQEAQRAQAAGMDVGNYWNRIGQYNTDRLFNYNAGQDALANALAERQALMQEAGLTGVYGGQPTMQATQNELANALAQRQMGLQERGLDWQMSPTNPANQRYAPPTLRPSDYDLRQTALEYAMSELGAGASAADINERADWYFKYLLGANASDLNIWDQIGKARTNGYSDLEIAAQLRAQGIDPKRFGLRENL